MRERLARLIPFLPWLPLATVIVAGGFAVFFFGYAEVGVFGIGFGVGALLTAGIVAPGMVISGVLNHVLLWRGARPPAVSRVEGILFGVQLVLACLLVGFAFDQESYAWVPLTLVIIAVAIATTVVLRRRPRTGSSSSAR